MKNEFENGVEIKRLVVVVSEITFATNHVLAENNGVWMHNEESLNSYVLRPSHYYYHSYLYWLCI